LINSLLEGCKDSISSIEEGEIVYLLFLWKRNIIPLI